MPARYIKEQQAGCGAVAKYHRKRGAGMPPGDDAVPEDEATPGAQDPKTTPACPKALNRLLGQGISRNCPVNARLRDCHITDIPPLREAVTYRYSPGMTTYGYIRTSRQRIQGTSGSDPASQAHQLHQDGVPEANIFRDVGVSGGTGTNSRAGWRALNTRLAAADTLVVVAIDRIGRRWMDTVNTVRDLRARQVKIRSLAQSEATWVTYLDADPDTAEAVIGDILTTFMAWAAEQELQAVSRRTRAGLEKARAEGKTLGPPRIVDDGQVEAMARLRREGQSLRSIGRLFGVSRTTVQRRLQEAMNLEEDTNDR